MSPVKATVNLPSSASSNAFATGANAGKLAAANSAHTTSLLERESVIDLILVFAEFPNPAIFVLRMSHLTAANLTVIRLPEFYKSDILFENTTRTPVLTTETQHEPRGYVFFAGSG
jgi:hypothetical protein